MFGHGSIQTQSSSVWTGNKSKDRVIINVGGTRHECYISTIQNFPDTRLYWIAETALKMADFDPDGNEFFFDRHPGCFENILNYCRTGKLHCPNDVCGPLFEAELAFWGVDELMMEPCCWGTYTQHRDANKNLKMFDQMRDSDVGSDEEDDDNDDNEKQKQKNDNMGNFGRKLNGIRINTWNALEKPFSSQTAQILALICMLVIIISITTFCLETIEEFKNHAVFEVLEICYCTFFTTEFLIRLFCCPSLKKFMLSPMTWIDFISTAQFYISFFISRNYQFLFVARMIRIFRLFRFFKRLSGMQVIGQTLKASANELFLLCLIVFIPMVIFSTLMYYAEYENNNTNFKNIPETFWWAIITMTTVGYGDMYPKSKYGKVIGSLCACSGVLIVALPVSVIGSNFSLYYSYAQARMRLPKRKSPALVSADKALVHNNHDKGGSSTSLPEKSHSIVSTLGGIASVMVDLAIPQRILEDAEQPEKIELGRMGSRPSSIRERRHAILPAINPISKQGAKNQKGKNQKCSSTQPSVAGALSSIGAVFSIGVEQPLRSSPGPIITEKPQTYDEHCENENLLPTTQKNNSSQSPKKRNKSLPSLTQLFKNSKDKTCKKQLNVDDCNLVDMQQHSHSGEISDNCSLEYVRSPRGRVHRRVLHVDIEQYQPRKLSSSEHKARRKFSSTSRPRDLAIPNRKRSQSETEFNHNDVKLFPVNGTRNDDYRFARSVPTSSFLKDNSQNTSLSYHDSTFESESEQETERTGIVF